MIYDYRSSEERDEIKENVVLKEVSGLPIMIYFFKAYSKYGNLLRYGKVKHKGVHFIKSLYLLAFSKASHFLKRTGSILIDYSNQHFIFNFNFHVVNIVFY